MRLPALTAVVRLDFLDFLRVRWIVVGFLSVHLAEAFVMLVVYDQLIAFDYLRFSLPGLIMAAGLMAAFDQGRKVFWELQDRTHFYLRSLPVNITSLALARPIGAAVKALAYSGWLTTFLWVLSFPDLRAVLLAILAVAILGLGMGSLAIAVGSIARDFNEWSAVQAFLILVLTLVSTVFYPLDTLEGVSPLLSQMARINPLSGGAELVRWAQYSQNGVPLMALLQLGISLVIFLPLGVIVYGWYLKRGS